MRQLEDSVITHPGPRSLSARSRAFVIAAAMLALFLGALDALVMGAAMPTIVADLGGLPLYSWVFSSYLLTRAISLPIFGKLCDIFDSKRLYIVAIATFVLSSMLGGAAHSMFQLIVCRALQGIGAGGTFALAYIVVSDLSPPDKRAKWMGFISFVWGVASILGPALGGFIVAFFSWRWIFYVNVPLGCAALLGIIFYLQDVREKRRGASIDYLGALTLTLAVLGILTAFLLGGRTYPWLSPEIAIIFGISIVAGVGFVFAENSAGEPILSLSFFRNSEFSLANTSAFFSSFAIFSLSSFSPLFIQGALGKSPAQLGVAMVPLTLCWSAGSITCGQLMRRHSEKWFSLFGSCFLVASAIATLTFSSATSLLACSGTLALAGYGMGIVSVSTLLIVQESVDSSNLGVATASQQFLRTVGGTIGVGVSGSLVTAQLMKVLDPLVHSSLKDQIPASISSHLADNIETLFQPGVQATLSATVQKALQEAVAGGLVTVFRLVLATAVVSLLCCVLLPSPKTRPMP